jgi:hypothetical protein
LTRVRASTPVDALTRTDAKYVTRAERHKTDYPEENRASSS